MKILQANQINHIVGGTGFVIIQNIPTNGFSQKCLNALPAFSDFFLNDPSEESFILKMAHQCSIIEINKLLDRIESVDPIDIKLM